MGTYGRRTPKNKKRRRRRRGKGRMKRKKEAEKRETEENLVVVFLLMCGTKPSSRNMFLIITWILGKIYTIWALPRDSVLWFKSDIIQSTGWKIIYYRDFLVLIAFAISVIKLLTRSNLKEKAQTLAYGLRSTPSWQRGHGGKGSDCGQMTAGLMITSTWVDQEVGRLDLEVNLDCNPQGFLSS